MVLPMPSSSWPLSMAAECAVLTVAVMLHELKTLILAREVAVVAAKTGSGRKVPKTPLMNNILA